MWRFKVRFNKKEKLIGLAAGLVLLLGGGAAAILYGGGAVPNSSGSIDLSRGLVGWWKLDGNAKDNTPYAHNGTVNGATLTTDREAAANQAYNFNGTNQYIALPDNSFNSYTQGSISAWIKFSSRPAAAGAAQVFCAASSSNANALLVFDVFGVTASDTRIRIGDRLNNSFVYGSTNMSPNIWYHVTATASGSTWALYVNGVPETLTVEAGSNDGFFYSQETSGTMHYDIGVMNRSSGAIQFFNGSIDDVRVWNRPLNAAEVSVLSKEYNPSLAAASGENGLVGWWKLDGNSKDSSPYANNASPVNSPSLTTDRGGQSNRAYSFNGTNYFTVPNSTSDEVGGGSFSVSFWFNNSSSIGTSQLNILSKKIAFNGTNKGWMVWLRNSGGANGIEFRTNDGTTTNDTTQTNSTSIATQLSDGKWHNVVVSFSRTTRNPVFYTDGVNLGRGDGNIAPFGNYGDASIGLGIGATTSGAEIVPNGFKLDDVRLYNRALSASEVSAIYNSYNSQLSVSNLQQGLVGWWPMNNNAKDATPYSDNGTVSGASLTSDRESRSSSAYSFNGTSNYISAPINLSSYSVITVAFWLNWTSYANNDALAMEYTSNFNSNAGFIIDPNSSSAGGGKFTIGTSNGSGGFWSDNFPRPSAGAWHHYVIVFNHTAPANTLYVDGVAQTLTAQAHTAGSSSFANSSLFMMSRGGASLFGAGNLDDVRIWNRALSAGEASQLYHEYY